ELAKTAVGLREIARKIGRAQLIWDHQPKTVLLVTKIHDEQLVRITHQVAKWLVLEIGLTVLVEDRLEHDPAFGYSLLADELRSATDSDDSSPADKSQKIQFWTNEYCASAAGSAAVDFLITLGGDGTVLYAAWLFQQKCPPIIPFRLGSLGFLTTFDFASFRQSVRDLVLGPGLQKGLRMNFRIRFSCTILRHDPDAKHIGGNEADHGATFEILNDLTIDRGPSPFMSQLELYGNDNHLTTIHADGLTISTPTGSTAYSLSSGGSLVHPDVSAILVTPICPHTLSFRPMILPDTMEVRITVPEDSRATAFASFDGRKRVCLGRGDTVVVKAGVWPVPTVCWEDQSKDWFTGLERCLGWNKRERQKGLVGGGESGMEGIAW
ncbi:ATP-NAD kinase-like domain-containing protein, partial [Powellomyces hirtus]